MWPSEWSIGTNSSSSGCHASGLGARLPVGDVPLADVALPVERPVRDQVGAAALEALVEERRPGGPVERVAEQRPAGVVGAVHRRHLEVVPGGPVEVDDDGVEPERRRDRIRDRLEQGRLLGLVPDEPGDLQEAAKAVDGRRVLGHGATRRIGQAGAGVKGRPLGFSGLCGKWLSGNLCLLQFLQFLPPLVARRASLPLTIPAPRHGARGRPGLRRDDLGDGGRARLPLAGRRPQLARAGAQPARSGWRSSRSTSWSSTAPHVGVGGFGAARLARAPGREADRGRHVAVLPHEPALRARSRAGGCGSRCAAAGRWAPLRAAGLPPGCGAVSAVRGDP